MITPYNVMNAAKVKIHLVNDDVLDDVLLMESESAFTQFKNRQTIVEHRFGVDVCECHATMPCQTSMVTSLRFWNVNEQEVFPRWVNRLTQENFRRAWWGNAAVATQSSTNSSLNPYPYVCYRFNGNLIEFFRPYGTLNSPPPQVEGWKVTGTYFWFNYDADGNTVVPDDYMDGLSDYVCYRYYAFHGTGVNTEYARANAFKESYQREALRLNGDAGYMNTVEQIGIQHYTNAVGRKGMPWWNGGSTGA